MIEVGPIDLASLVDASEIECECMVCHLPFGAVHGPVEWRLTVHFPGPYPEPGDETMLLCTPCYEDWRDHAEDLYAIAGRSHKV